LEKSGDIIQGKTLYIYIDFIFCCIVIPLLG
jgi:hypothetical protein